MMPIRDLVREHAYESFKNNIANSTTFYMKSCDDRLNSFANWTVPYIDKRILAENGFYYLGEADKVRCAFCGVEIGCWERGDDPSAEHKRWFPNCPILKSTSHVQGVDECGFMMDTRFHKEDPLSSLLTNLGLETNLGMKYPQYALLDKRVTSYEHWPVSIKQRPIDLASAGFYYTGQGDQTICFHCGIGLNAWQDQDDPWEQHALWEENCTFLRLQKGTEFINQVKEKYSSAVLNQVINETTSSAAPSSSTMSLDTEQLCASLDIDIPKKNSNPVQPKPESNGSTETKEERDPSKSFPLCGICYEKERSIVNLPCKHMISCVDCSVTATTCPVCRQTVQAFVKAYLS